jgi:hypothetical protein
VATDTQIGDRHGIIYTCNCGWLDRGHASTRSSRPPVGTDWLWNSLLGERGPSDTLKGRPAYILAYRQDAFKEYAGMTFYPGLTKYYLVLKGLSFSSKAQVGLALLQ